MIPLEFMQKLAVLVPRPRLHLIRFHGVLAPNAKLRAQVVLQDCDQAQEPKAKQTEVKQTEEGEGQRDQDRPLRLGWARLIKRVLATT
jgi:Putative transposase